MVELLNWTITAWQMNGAGGWTTQPVILVEGRIPFYADHPQAYIDKLLELHDDPALIRLQSLYRVIGEFKDALEYFWQTEATHEDGANRNGDRQGSELYRA